MSESELDKELKRLRISEYGYRTLLDESSDPIFSFYPDGTYRYVNRAFADGVGLKVENIIGHKIWDVFPKDEAEKRFGVIKKVFLSGKPLEIEVRVPLPSGDAFYLTTVKPVITDNNSVETVICTSKNITSRKNAEMSLQDERDKLAAALEEIQTLSGLLPICSACHKIRNDSGYWHKLEAYIQEHTEAQFSHTTCPECTTKLYGDLLD